MLSVRGVTKRYDRVLANDHLSFDVGPGEITILLGPNGAGKSTLIKCIAGLLKFEGVVLIDGHDNKSMEAKRALGYVPELPVLYDMLTVWEHLEFIARAYRLRDWKAKADVLLERFELADKKNKLGSDLSKGMQQKLSLSCGLITDPKVILLDEPMVGLDPHAIKELKSIIVERKHEGSSILISTHLLDSVAGFWDSANIMMNGKIAASRSRSLASDNKELEDLYFEITEGGHRDPGPEPAAYAGGAPQ
ncbi:MAG TPA: ABC transporter ATP-binding protein [Candidatus Atribacteria bacterium]|nr:ABC transporter ATP-binding protein [Candidatus Atribacteria bacterium]HPT79270.1 ABC transporter ATP-binding protein [Candidatus Atribacteria bacterium]